MARMVLLSMFVVFYVERMLGVESFVRGLSVKNVFLYVILLGLIIRAAMNKRLGAVELPTLHVAFFLLVGYAILSWFFTDQLNLWDLSYDKEASLVVLKNQLLDHLFFFLVFFYVVKDRDDALWVAKRVIALVAFSNVLTVIDVFDIPDLGIIHEREDSRVSGPLGESNQYGAFLVLFLPAIIAMTFLNRGLQRALWALGALASLTVLLLTTSRGALVGLAAGVMFGGLYLRRFIPVRQVVLAAGATLAVGGLVTILVVGAGYGDLFYERYVGQTDLSDIRHASSGRSENWTNAIVTQSEHPITFLSGVGWDSYRTLFSRASHNTYLAYLFELGMVALLVYLVLMASVLSAVKRGVAAAPTPRQRVEMVVFSIGFIALLGAVFFVNLFHPWLLVWAYTGLMLRVAVATQGHAPPHVVPQTAGGDGPIGAVGGLALRRT